MIEIFVIIILVILLGFQEYHGRKERKELINAVIAKNAAELANLQFIDKVKVDKQKPEGEPDLTPISDLGDEEFDKFILQHAT